MAVFAIKDRARLRNLCLAVCLLCLGARILCVYLVPEAYLKADILYRFTPLRADALLLGGALALMLRGPEASRVFKILPKAFWTFVTGCLIFETLYHFAFHHLYTPAAGAPVLGTIGYSLIDVFAGILILLSLNTQGELYKFLTARPLRRLGQISYGFYVFHDIPHVAYEFAVERLRVPLPGLVVAVMAFAGTLLLSYLSFRFFEAPFLRLKDRFTT